MTESRPHRPEAVRVIGWLWLGLGALMVLSGTIGYLAHSFVMPPGRKLPPTPEQFGPVISFVFKYFAEFAVLQVCFCSVHCGVRRSVPSSALVGTRGSTARNLDRLALCRRIRNPVADYLASARWQPVPVRSAQRLPGFRHGHGNRRDSVIRRSTRHHASLPRKRSRQVVMQLVDEPNLVLQQTRFALLSFVVRRPNETN
jgi:hypothetical protein